ncbi:hexosyltransferase [Elysia marginata]|uniref:Hexosyltransferase n=1 Tax=Elysia marginata TaxID=1093978 RepID=A0AAV4JJZ5_9GAST|nr:hexosyltransferase [Elysia marginata]
MKYVVFPVLMAVTLGLFLAFSRAVSSTSLSKGFSHYQNSRQLSEDEPAYMARGHLMFPGILGDHHRAMFNPGEMAAGQNPLAWRGMGGGIVGGVSGVESCDCSRCELNFVETDAAKFKRLVKHSLQHFYGRQELAMQMEAFVPSKTKQWTLSPTFYITANHVCSDVHSLLAVIIVHAHHRHSAERNAIRETWGSVAKGNAWPRRQLSGEVRLIFVLEVSDDPIDNDFATKESDKFGDIVLVDVQVCVTLS